MNIFWKVLFSIFMASVILLAIEYIVLVRNNTNDNPILVVGIAQAMIIYRAIVSFEKNDV